VPAAASFRRRADPASGDSRSLEEWSRRLRHHWPEIRFGEPAASVSARRLTVSVPVDLGGIGRDDVRVELYADPEQAGEAFVCPMTPAEAVPGGPNAAVYRTTIDTGRPPEHFTARVVPHHPAARLPIELPLIAWQR
jgi:starch phosphorylase